LEEQNKNENNNANTNQPHQNSEEGKGPSQNYNRRNFYNRRRNFYKRDNRTTQSAQDKSTFKKLSIVIPLYNEEESINLLVAEIKKGIRQAQIDFEVIFVDDGSTDNSLKVIKDIAKADKKFRYVSFQKNFGKSAALQIGFKQCTGDVVITMDADLQDDPNEIPNLLKKLDEGFDLVSGWKKKRHDPFIKNQSSKFFNFITRIFTGIKIHDFNCGLKAYRKAVVENIKVYGELHRYIPVLAKWQGFTITEIPVKHQQRLYGKTKYGISRFFKGFIDLLTVIFTTRYVKRPMHLFGFLGAFSFLIGFVVNGILSYEWLFSNKPLSNRPMLFLGMLLIIVGIQFFSVGLLGELMVHNFQDDKEYTIKDKTL
jgi:glycosyltransferase involved in cell wall biosynthesis